MPDSLYDSDALAWGEQQAVLLTRMAAGEPVNEPVDWPHVIEDIQEVGLSDLRACRSLLVQAMSHLLKLAIWPTSDAAAPWRAETAGFVEAARRSVTPSMRQRIELSGLWADAQDQLGAMTADMSALPPLPERCPFALDDLIGDRPDPRHLVARLNIPPAAC
jgi:hypothetical protein